MSKTLSAKECIPCKGGVPKLEGKALTRLLAELGHAWQLIDEHHLEKEYAFGAYQAAVDFTVRVAGIAEEQNHHPDILLTWGKVKVTIWTHKIDGLTESDFIFAAKTEEAYA